MIPRIVGRLSAGLAAACALATVAPAAQTEPPAVTAARAFLGTDAALDAVRSIHFTGTLTTSIPADPKQAPVHAAIEIYFQKPLQHRVILRMDKTVATKVLDGYDAWTRTEDVSDPAKLRITWLSPEQTKGLRASTWENLYFYRGIEHFEGVVQDRGQSVVDGVACEEVDFIHGPGLFFKRYFERQTGRLVLTDTGTETIRQSGRRVVQGVVFPTTVESDSLLGAGKVEHSVVVFDRITVNEAFPPGLFGAPDLLPTARPVPAAPAADPAAARAGGAGAISAGTVSAPKPATK